MLRDIYLRYGIYGFLLNTFFKFLSFWGVKVSGYYLLFKPLNDEEDEVFSTSFRLLSYSDFKQQKDINKEWFNTSKLEAMKKSFSIDGNEAYGCFDGNLLICYGWVSLNYWGLNDMKLKDTDGYLWDDYTHPNYRGKGLHKNISAFRYKKLGEKKKKRALTIVALYNKASLVGFKRNGFITLCVFINYKLWFDKQRTTLKYNSDEK